MIAISVSNLSKSYGTDVILKGINFHLNEGDRVGLVGRNGAGKTTLLNMLLGELDPDEGQVFISKNLNVGYLKQRENFLMEGTVLGEAEKIFDHLKKIEKEIEDLANAITKNSGDMNLIHRMDELQEEYGRKGGYTYKSEVIGILNSMAFTEEYYDKKISTLSGGERTRLALAMLLLSKPDILVLDEPTNHLDIGTLSWLEQYINQYRGTVIIVSHDRYFLDQTVNKIFEIENHKLTTYNGNYSTFLREKAKNREIYEKAYINQQKEIARQEEMIRIMKEHNTEHLVKRAQSREKRLDMIERLDKPEALEGKIKIDFVQDFQSGSDVIFAEDLAKSFGVLENKKKLFENVNLDIKRGEKICIVGANGIGKTTLLKILLEDISPDKGRVKLGHNVKLGYYDQGQMLLNPNNTVLEEMKDEYHLYSDTKMRGILGRFLFKGDDVFLKIRDISGGEKARLSLLKMMLSGANTLILDEPTNHMDIESKEVFEEALREFPGTAIIVTHDRYFLKKIPNRILELTPDGMVEYLGKYDYYLEKKNSIKSAKQYMEEMRNDKDSSQKGDAKLRDEFNNLSSEEKRALNKKLEAEARRIKRAKEKLEIEMEEIEEKIEALQTEMMGEETKNDYELLGKLGTEIEKLKFTQDDLMTEWLMLDEEGQKL